MQKHINSNIKLERISAGHYQFEGWIIFKLKHDGRFLWWQAEHPEKDVLTANTLSDIKCLIYLAEKQSLSHLN